jgi:eukaryotic-like serine/threonine-protein kinase
MTGSLASVGSVRFGLFEFNLDTGELRRSGMPVRLAPQPCKVLTLLVERPGQLVTREELRNHVWDGATFVDFDQGLNFCVKQLRAALGDTAETPRYVETVPRRGYRFIMPLQPAVDARAAVEQPVNRSRRWGTIISAAAIVVLASFGWFAVSPRSAEPRPLLRFEIPAPPGQAYSADAVPTISPDGTAMVVAILNDQRQSSLWLRAMSEPKMQPLPDTEDASAPFWAPDGRHVGFFANGLLKRIDIAQRTVTTIAPVVDGRGGSWNVDDVLLVGQRAGPLLRVVASGGTPVAATVFDAARDVASRWPHFLPDGRHYVFLNRSARRDRTGVYVGELGSPNVRRVLADDTNAVFADGYLFYVREPLKEHVPLISAWRTALVDRATLVAQRFDTGRFELRGDAITIADDVRYYSSSRFDVAAFSASAGGLLAYRKADQRPRTRMFWFDRTGRQAADFGEDTFLPHPEISPDGTRVAFQRFDIATGNSDIWVADLVHNVRTRLTFDPAVDGLPVWSPDGQRIAFTSDRTGQPQVFVKDINGSSTEQRVAQSPFVMFPTAWSRDGRSILIQHHRGDGATTLDAISADGRQDALVFAEKNANDASAQFSPDGKWVAHASGMTDGTPQVIIQDFPQHAGTWQITTTNGWEPRWRGDGREVFYLSISDDGVADVMAVTVDGTTKAFKFGNPRRLFSVPVWMGPPAPRNHYTVTRDGDRFIMDTVLQRPRPEPITAVVDWRLAARTPSIR